MTTALRLCAVMTAALRLLAAYRARMNDDRNALDDDLMVAIFLLTIVGLSAGWFGE